MKIRRYLLSVVPLLVIGSAAISVAYASFTDQTKFAGSRFSVGSADLKLVNNLAGGVESGNLVDDKPAPTYDGIYSLWTADYLVKLVNNGNQVVNLTSNMDYLTANDPGNIREVLYVEPIDWTDANGNGEAEADELGTSAGKKAFTSWKSTGYDFGNLAPGQVKGYVMRFSAGTLTNAKMGQTGIYDFVFDAVGL